jgi:phosphoesterase RecJ-like protein
MHDINSDNISRLEKLISQARRVAIVTHMKPDGDAMGSSVALYHFIGMCAGHSVKIVLNDRYPEYLGFLTEDIPESDIIVYQERPVESETAIKDSDLVICLDFNAFHRTDRLENALTASRRTKCS